MTLTVTIPALVAAGGAVLFLFSPHAKVSEMGRIAFGFGVLVLLLGIK